MVVVAPSRTSRTMRANLGCPESHRGVPCACAWVRDAEDVGIVGVGIGVEEGENSTLLRVIVMVLMWRRMRGGRADARGEGR